MFPFASRRKPQEEAGAALALCSAMHFDCCRGTRDIRLWMQKGTLGPALAALCGMLPQPIQVSKPSKGPPSLWLLLRGSVPRRGTKEHRGRVIGLSAPSTHLYPSRPAGQVLGLPPLAPSQTSGLGQWPGPGCLCLRGSSTGGNPEPEEQKEMCSSAWLFVVTFSCTWPSSGGDVGLQSQPAHLLALIVKVVTWSCKRSLLPLRGPLQGLH